MIAKPSPEQNAEAASLIINNAGNNNNNNTVSNGNDDIDGNLVNGNGNGDNSNSGNVAKLPQVPPIILQPLIINNAGSNNSANAITNGDDNVDGNLVNGNENGNNSGSGNIGKIENNPPVTSTTGENSGLEDLLTQIDALLSIVTKQLNEINKIPNDPKATLLPVLTQVREILHGLLRQVNNDVNSTPKLKHAVSKLVAKINAVVGSVVGKLSSSLGNIISALQGILNAGNHTSLALVPALLQKVIDLLARLI